MSWTKHRDSLNPPNKIDNCPIVEAIVDLRFDAEGPDEAVFGMLYTAIKPYFDAEVQELPITEIPKQIRSRDPQLQFQAHYKLQKGNKIVQIGPKVISFIVQKEYIGWTKFQEFIEECLSPIVEAKIIKKFIRVGIRYINVISENFLDVSTLQIGTSKGPIESVSANLHLSLETGEFISGVRLSDNAKIQLGGQSFEGSVIDIDTYQNGIWDGDYDMMNTITKGHDQEKRTFFALLKEEYIKTLNPDYE